MSPRVSDHEPHGTIDRELTGPFQLRHPCFGDEVEPLAESVGDPDVALAVDAHPLAALAEGRELYRLAWIGGRETNHRVAQGVGDPDRVLLVDSKVEWALEQP